MDPSVTGIMLLKGDESQNCTFMFGDASHNVSEYCKGVNPGK